MSVNQAVALVILEQERMKKYSEYRINRVIALDIKGRRGKNSLGCLPGLVDWLSENANNYGGWGRKTITHPEDNQQAMRYQCLELMAELKPESSLHTGKNKLVGRDESL